MKKLVCLPLSICVLAVACGDNPTTAAPDVTQSSIGGSHIAGAIYTTDAGCSGVDLNIYASKNDVYLQGGPRNANAAGLTPGSYFVRVTEPDGTPLGTSATAAVTVGSDGRFVSCYQLSSILLKASNGEAGYDDTSNPGGEYKVWISTTAEFNNSSSKTDNFKVKGTVPPVATWLRVRKFYDANTDGVMNGTETYLLGWKVGVNDQDRYTDVNMQVEPGTYAVSEYTPVETNWVATQGGPFSVTLAAGGDQTVTFGNVCIGAGGGLTLGFWSNKNGQSIMNSGAPYARLGGLNLVGADGAAFDPMAYAAFRTWILSANATNMAYMLSAQLAAMSNNVAYLKVSGTAMIHAPGAEGANSAGFMTVNALMSEANASLGANPHTVQSGAARSYQEALKNALDRGNNNLNFAQAQPCAFTF